ncbi:MAG TPA: hypothetical protein PK843_00805 [bacterium]|nr:hypothetical protein [bacterium]
MFRCRCFQTILTTALAIGALFAGEEKKTSEWTGTILPAEHRTITDPKTGHPIRFLTTNAAVDRAFYFTHNAFLPDGSMIVVSSNRFGRSEYLGYLTATGELARFLPANAVPAGLAVVSKHANILYVVRDREVCEWRILIDSEATHSVKIRERIIGAVPPGWSLKEALTESADGSLLSLSAKLAEGKSGIAAMDIQTGAVRTVLETDLSTSHVQFSHNRPDLLMFAGTAGADHESQRMWLVDFSGRGAWKLHEQKPGELVTHECWWVGDLVTFCGGFAHEGFKVESHLKIVDINTQQVRILGAGCYWPQGTDSEVAELNWWHASGDPYGRWVAADNWHGGVAIFNARTTEKHLLTTGHRTYGRGTHPEVGWDTKGRYVIFGSEYFGNPDVCIAEIPKEWNNP